MGEACLPRRTPVKQKATAILYCLGLLQLKTTHAMARFCSLLTELLHVKNLAVIHDFDVCDINGVVRAHFDLRPYKRLQQRCPHCGARCPGYDCARAEPRQWRALDLGGILVYLRYAPRRIHCPVHGIVTEAVPWAFPDSRFTKEFDLQVAWLARNMSSSKIKELMRIDWHTVGRVTRAQKHLDPDADKRRLDGLIRIGVDETSYRKGHKYMTVDINHDTGEVVWLHENHGKTVFEKFFQALTDEQRASIQYVSGDGARWIDECIEQYVPHAKRCVDPFHVVQWAGQAVDMLRKHIWQVIRAENRDLFKQIKGTQDERELRELKARYNEQETLAKGIKRSAYALGKAPENLTPLQEERLQLIAESHPQLFKAYKLKEELRLILKLPSQDVEVMLKRWYWRASHSRIEVIRELARKIKRHKDNIFNTIQNGLSNARLEAINNKIKLLIRRAYGFRNLESMFAFIQLICSNVRIPLPNRPEGI